MRFIGIAATVLYALAPGAALAEQQESGGEMTEVNATPVSSSDSSGTATTTQTGTSKKATLLGDGLTAPIGLGVTLRGMTAGGNVGSMLGVKLATTMHEQLILGIAAYGTLVRARLNDEVRQDGGWTNHRYLEMIYGGLLLGWIVTDPKQMAYIAAHTTVAGGAIGHRAKEKNRRRDGWDTFWVTEPAVAVHFNVTDALRGVLAFGYRWSHGVDLKGFDPENDEDIKGADGFNLDLTIEADIL